MPNEALNSWQRPISNHPLRRVFSFQKEIMTTDIQIVQIAIDGEPRASTQAISSGYELQHKNVMALLRRYMSEIEELGRVDFEKLPFETNGGIQTHEVALLNRDQTMLLLSFMRNNAKVVEFKVRLIQQFRRMAEALQNRDMTMWDRRLKFEARDQASKTLGSHGSKLMHARRKEKPALEEDRRLIEAEMEPPLFLN